MHKRRHFILRSPKSPVAASKVDEYGIRHSFELRGFVERLDRAEIIATPRHEGELSSFLYVDLAKDNKLPSRPTSAEIQELFAFGRSRFDAIKSTVPLSEYVVYRARTVAECINLLENNKTLAIHSRIGNGKSTVTDELKVMLSQSSRRCFILRNGINPVQQDIEFLRAIGDPVIFFPNYDSAVSNIHLFDDMPDGTRYVVEIPSSTLQVRLQEVTQKLPGKVARLSVDRLDGRDVVEFRSLLEKAGLTALARRPEVREGVEFRDFLLLAYSEPEIARRLKASIEPLMNSTSAKRIICASAVFKASGLPVDVGFLEDATGEDPYEVLSGLGEHVHDLIDFTIDRLEPHSSVLSEHILRKYVDAKDFVGAIFDLAAEAARRIDQTRDYSSERFRRARSLLSAVLRFGFLESILGRSGEGRKLIGRLYESCRRDTLIQREPLFWLQYSIYWQDVPRWDLAESHMIEAYARGAARPEFKTYQLDTNYFGLLCDLETADGAGKPVTRFDKLIELMETCRVMIDDGNHRDHVTKAFQKVEQMVQVKIADFTKAQASVFTFNLNLVVSKLDGFTPFEKALSGSETCKQSLKRSVSQLVKLTFQ